MKTDTAIPLALIITELITNSFKYAFPNQKECEIGVILREVEGDEFLLEVYDTGIGIDKKVVEGTPKSLGLRLTKILSSQIFAKKWYIKTERSSFFFQFPKTIIEN